MVSAGASMLYGFVALSEVPPERRLALVREHAPVNAGVRISDENLQKMDLVLGAGSRRRRRAMSKRQLAETRKQVQSVADEGWRGIRQDAEEPFDAYNARGLEDAVNSGLIDIHAFEGNTVEGMMAMAAEGHTTEATIEDILREYVERASIAIDGTGYPLFGDMLGRLVNDAVREGLIVPSPFAAHRGRHGGLAGDLLGRLPLFEEAMVAEASTSVVRWRGTCGGSGVPFPGSRARFKLPLGSRVSQGRPTSCSGRGSSPRWRASGRP